MKIENLAGGELDGERFSGAEGGVLDSPQEALQELPLAKSRGQRAFPAGKLIISDIRQGVKNPNRANIFINGKYSFSLDIAQVVDLKVRIGREITEEELAELKKASEFGKLYQRTLEWVLMRPRSVKETRDYLRRKIYDKKLDNSYLDNILECLSSKGYLDDRKFAAYYVENRFVKKGISQRRLTMELFKKGIDKGIVEEVLTESERDETEEARKIIAKKRGRYDDEKLIAYLVRQGFSYQLARSLVLDSGTD